MKGSYGRIALLSLVLMVGCNEDDAGEPAHWGYEGDQGPEHWSELAAGFSACGDGESQSPIAIETAAAVQADLPDLTFDYTSTPLDIVNNGHTIQVNVGSGQKLIVGEDAFELAQFHFHGPSEHTLDGQHAALEVHLVHKDAAGHLAVVGVMIRPGAEHPSIAAAWSHMPREAGASARPAGVEVGLPSFLPEDRRYFHYEGSLTTPPCTEGVRWYVLAQGIEASAAQIAAFGDVIRPNNRPVQPLNARTVSLNSN